MKRITLLVAVMLLTASGMALADDQEAPRAHGRDVAPGMNVSHPMAPMAPMGPGVRGMRRGMGRGMGMRQGEGMQHLLAMADKLNLSDQQREKLRGMFADFATERIDRQADLEKAQVRLASFMRDDKANEADVNRAIDEVARLRADLQKMQYAHHKAVMGVLTDKQRDQLKQLRQDRRGRRNNQMNDNEDGNSGTPDQVIPPYRPRRGSL